jgi:hypothetical protein
MISCFANTRVLKGKDIQPFIIIKGIENNLNKESVKYNRK